jgi:prevent-host-death family protein
MHTFGIYEAKAKLSAILEMVANGEQVIISKHGEPMFEISKIKKAPKKNKIKFGTMKGQIKIMKGFYDPLPEDFTESFYNSKIDI